MTDVPRETADRLRELKALVLAENRTQNLVGASTSADFDRRHLDDSLQLLRYIPGGVLVDVGTGGGFPGLVLASCREGQTHLIEPRSRRAAFLQHAVEELGLSKRVRVWQCKVERIELSPVDAITARAVTSLDRLFALCHPISGRSTRWVLPKGRNAQSELDTARITWQGEFELVPSETDSASWIVLATNVQRRPRP